MVTPRGYIFLGLNAIRVLSIISLILVFSSSIVVMVTNIKAVNAFDAAKGSDEEDSMYDCDYIEGSSVPNQPAGVFWAVVSSLLIIFQSIILLLSEIGWPSKLFDRYFPVLGSEFGLGALGIFQGLIGAQILSHHVDEFTLVSAFFLFSLGCVNMLLGLIFRESAKSKRCILTWRNESKSPLPHFDLENPVQRSFTGATSRSNESWRNEKASLGFGRQAENFAARAGYGLQTPPESLPRYITPPPTFTSPPPTFASVPAPTFPIKSSTRTKSSTSSFSSPNRHSGARTLSYAESDEDYNEEEHHEPHAFAKRPITPRPLTPQPVTQPHFQSSDSAI